MTAAAGVVLSGLTAGAAYQLVAPEGLFGNPDAVGLVANQHFQPPLPEVSYEEVQALLARPGTAVVDARLAGDYRRGHIPGAISLPVVSGVTERRAASARLPRDGPVVVYCQSQGCVWADSVATDLYYRGHAGVCIYRDGWRGWRSHE